MSTVPAPLLVPGVPLPPAPVWPAQAASEYPQTPNTANTDEAGVNMDTQSTANGNTASATLGVGSDWYMVVATFRPASG